MYNDEDFEYVFYIINDRSKQSLLNDLKESLEKLKDCDPETLVKVNLHQSLALDREVLDKIFAAHKNVLINVFYDENDLRGRKEFGGSTLNGQAARMTSGVNQYMYSREETKTFVENYNYVREKYGAEIVINHEFTVEMAVNATNKVNDWAEKILSTKVDGKPLSPFEKYLMAYQIVTHYAPYKEYPIDGATSRQSRDLVSVLNEDYIVCVGYAKLLCELCSKIGIDCSCQMIKGHQICSLDIADEKYGIDGRYLADATRQYATDVKNAGDIDLGKALIHYSDSENLYGKNTLGDNILFSYTDIDVFNMPFDEYKKMIAENFLMSYIDQMPESECYKIRDISFYDVVDFLDEKIDVVEFFDKINLYAKKDQLTTKEELKKQIMQVVDSVEYEAELFTNWAGGYAKNRESNAKKVTPENLLSAYDTILKAFKFDNQEDRDEIILDAIETSKCDAYRGSMFYGFEMEDTEAYKVFEEMKKDRIKEME